MKKKILLIISILVCIAAAVTTAVMIAGHSDRKEEPVKDIVVEGDTVKFAVDRKFYLYDEDPLSSTGNGAEPLKEVKVVLNGTANVGEELDGEVYIEGFELGGNMQSCCVDKFTGNTEDDYIWFVKAEGLNVDKLEPAEGDRYTYEITITSDLKTISCWIIKNGNAEESFWVVSNGDK